MIRSGLVPCPGRMAESPWILSKCPGGGIGRHASLRDWFPKGIAGSNPVLGTNRMALWANWLSRHPFKVETTGSSPVGATTIQVLNGLEAAAGVNSHGLMNKIAAILVRLVFP